MSGIKIGETLLLLLTLTYKLTLNKKDLRNVSNDICHKVNKIEIGNGTNANGRNKQAPSKS